MKEFIGTRLPEGITKGKLQSKAWEYDFVAYTQLIQLGIQILVDWDTPFYKMLKDYADGLHTTIGAVIENMILRTFAEREAHKQVWGPSGQLLPEFSVMGNKPLTGLELFSFLKDWFVQKEERERVNLLLREEKQGLLTDDDKAFLIKKRAGQTWLESAEFAKEQREEKEAKTKASLTPKQQEEILATNRRKIKEGRK